MRLPSPAVRPPLPVPPSVLLTLVWVGLVRLFFLWAEAQARWERDGEVWAALLFGERVMGRARLPTVIVAISFLLLVYLWLDYRSRPASGPRTVVFLLAAALLVFLGWAVWSAWWSHIELPLRPGAVLMTALGGGGPA